MARDPDLSVVVPGKPRPQGSMQLSRDPRSGREFAKYGQQTVLHRNLVVGQLRDAWGDRERLTGPVAVRCTFRFARPKSHYGTGRNAGVLKDWAPIYMTSAPDTDKGLRLVLDALTIAGVIEDDALVAVTRGEKLWADQPSTVIEVYALDSLRARTV